MSSPSIYRRAITALALLMCAFGCSSQPDQTHRGDLLDDKVTQQRVQAALTRAGAPFQPVQVQCTNGVVILNGTVKSPQIRLEAGNIARNVHRGSRLENNLKVNP